MRVNKAQKQLNRDFDEAWKRRAAIEQERWANQPCTRSNLGPDAFMVVIEPPPIPQWIEDMPLLPLFCLTSTELAQQQRNSHGKTENEIG